MNRVSAGVTGFENPCNLFKKKALNLTDIFVHSKSSMKIIPSPQDYIKFGISSGDWLLVDSGRQPSTSDIILVERFGESHVLLYSSLASRVANSECCIFEDITVAGVICLSIHHFRPPINIPEHSNLNELDLHELLITQEYSSVICRASGKSMMPHIFDNDILILERHLTVHQNDVCILSLNNDLVCKRVDIEGHVLNSDNPNFKPYTVGECDYIRMHGVVRYSLRLHT